MPSNTVICMTMKWTVGGDDFKFEAETFKAKPFDADTLIYDFHGDEQVLEVSDLAGPPCIALHENTWEVFCWCLPEDREVREKEFRSIIRDRLLNEAKKLQSVANALL